jgi:phosphopantothenoylcysteine decarboxylase/phosphopantothenate--cysteine ligase
MGIKGKNIIVGISGGIAAYKSAELVRLLKRAGASVKVAMTKNATEFVSPLTFEALSGNRVIWDMFLHETHEIEHITWAQESDLIIIAPATANLISKVACGIGDDFLTTLLLATTAKVLMCPSMNTQMFNNQAIQQNIATLKQRGYEIMDPGSGELVCKTVGPGRLPEPELIVEKASVMLSRNDLDGMSILVTAGATREHIDPVRFISNRSTGKMGYAIARVAKRRGARVILVSGVSTENPPLDIEYVEVRSALEMRDAVLKYFDTSDVVVKAAAVSDYRPAQMSDNKIKKGPDSISLELVKNPDILGELGKKNRDGRCILVGFAAETQDLISNAMEKLSSKGLDMIVANDVSRDDSGFESDTNLVKLLFDDGKIEELPLMSKEDVADVIMDRVLELWKKKKP